MKKKTLIITLVIFINIIFIDFVSAQTYNNYDPSIGPVSCGNGLMNEIPAIFPKVISILYTAIQIAVPVVLVIMGSLDLMKGITAGKDDDIKKGQQMFIKRLISGALVFLVFIAVKLVISFAAEGTGNSLLECTQCFIKNECSK